MDHKDLQGTGVALITPFDDCGAVDYGCLGALVDYQIESGTDYLVVLGTTAETPALDADEAEEIKRFVKNRVAGRVPLVVGCGGNSTAHVCRQLREGYADGFDAILSVVPYYNKPAQRGLEAHFDAVAQASPVPVILYNIPGRTGVNMLPDTTIAIARRNENIIGIKEASGILGQINRIIGEVSRDFAVISGDDALAFPVASMGGAGVISVLANAFPAETSRMVRMALEGNTKDALALHRIFTPLFHLLFVEGNPAGIKQLMKIRSLAENNLRLPLVTVSEGVADKMRNACRAIENNLLTLQR